MSGMIKADDTDEFPEGFADWLTQQLGPCQWVVARNSKRLRAKGYDKFFTQKRFRALRGFFQKEITPMDDPSLHLTEPNPALAEHRRKTPHGMAHWGGTGPQGTTCRGCRFWHFDGYLVSTGLLKDTICDKYQSMMNGQPGGRLPHYTPSCKYFDPTTQERSIEKR